MAVGFRKLYSYRVLCLEVGVGYIGEVMEEFLYREFAVFFRRF